MSDAAVGGVQFCFWLWFVAAELAKHVPRIVLIPEGKSYKAAAKCDLIGIGSMDGAGGES